MHKFILSSLALLGNELGLLGLLFLVKIDGIFDLLLFSLPLVLHPLEASSMLHLLMVLMLGLIHLLLDTLIISHF